jgi:spermidine/putrescine transport system permease protein
MTVRRVGLVATVLLFLFLFAPLVFVAVLSFGDAPQISFPIRGVTLDWYTTFLNDAVMQRGMVRSVILALITALGAGAVGTAIAVALVRHRFVGRAALAALTTAPMVLPRIILGTMVLILLHQLRLPRGYAYLAIGHIVMALPYVVLVISAQLLQVSRSLEEAAVNLGCTRLRTFFEVTLPLAVPGVIASMLFAFTISFQDAEASLMWASPSSTTLPVSLLTMMRTGLTPEINVVAVVMMVLSVGLAIVAERLLVSTGARRAEAADRRARSVT